MKTRRFLVGISGIPASGKTVFAELLKRFINRDRRFGLNAQTVYLDGFHLHQKTLYKRKIKTKDGRFIPLIKLKGSPGTYNVRRAKRYLKMLVNKEEVMFPEYDRNLHEPVENRVRIGHEHNIVLIEGNYLFYEKWLWKGLKDIFHLRLFIDIPLNTCRSRIIARHIRGGIPPKQAWAKYIENDYPNSLIISSTRKEADIIIKKNIRHRYTAMTSNFYLQKQDLCD